MISLLEPGAIYVSAQNRSRRTRRDQPLHQAKIVSGTPTMPMRFHRVGCSNTETPDVAKAFAAVTPEHRKFLFTSGSTGMPKAVIKPSAC